MDEERTEGIVIREVPYQERHKVITCFTPDRGVIGLFAKGKTLASRVNGLTHVELIYHQRSEEGLFRLVDTTLLDPLLDLRDDFDRLQLAGALVQIIGSTQLLWKPAPALYHLLLAYLKRLTAPSHATKVSFLLKVLRHEGLLGPLNSCSRCGQADRGVAIGSGEVFCHEHAPSWALTFSPKEAEQLDRLLRSRSMNTIEQEEVAPNLQQKIHDLFNQLISG